ncbi:hypothetical protein INR49_012687 [Caranx melampygus]|nr:hypothetical protein INR49_012687 [Caranx melampygus]
MVRLWSDRHRITSSPPTLLFRAQVDPTTFILIVQTSPSRLAGASAVTSPIHRSLDACQPGAARAVSMETSNKRASAPQLLRLTCVARGALRTNRPRSFVVHLSP